MLAEWRKGEREETPLQGEDSLKERETSSGECHVDGNAGRGQNENGDQLVPFILSDEGQETESDIYSLSHRRHRVSIKGGVKTMGS